MRKFLQSLDENEDLSKEIPTLIPKFKTSKDIINRSPKEQFFDVINDEIKEYKRNGMIELSKRSENYLSRLFNKTRY